MMESPIIKKLDKCIAYIKKYKEILHEASYRMPDLEQSSNFLYRNKEIIFQIDHMVEDLDTLMKRMQTGDYSLTPEENMIKLRKFLFIMSMIST